MRKLDTNVDNFLKYLQNRDHYTEFEEISGQKLIDFKRRFNTFGSTESIVILEHEGSYEIKILQGKDEIELIESYLKSVENDPVERREVLMKNIDLTLVKYDSTEEMEELVKIFYKI